MNRISSRRRKERGYILLTLMLFLVLIGMAAMVAAPGIAFEARRDREQELIHRALQYTRAVRAFSTKFGRYPSNLSELENTNGLRFLRKRYKDPITGKDFKLLHIGDVTFTPGAGIDGIPQSRLHDLLPGPLDDLPPWEITSFKGSNAAAAGTAPSSAPGTTSSAQSTSSKQDASSNNTPDVMGLIVGVVSTSGARSIREFNHKNRYNQWKFFYDPAVQAGVLANGPTEPYQFAVRARQAALNSASKNNDDSQPGEAEEPAAEPEQPEQ